jgi:hypothetical protein
LFTPHVNRRRCGKPVTLADNLAAGQKGIAVPPEPFKKLDVSWSGIRAGDIIAIPLPKRMRAAPKARHSGKGCAVETMTIGGVFMKSTVVKRSIVLAGHKTSVSLEDAFWNGLKESYASGK